MIYLVQLINDKIFEYENDRYTFEYWDNCFAVTDTVDDSVVIYPWTSILSITKVKAGTNDGE